MPFLSALCTYAMILSPTRSHTTMFHLSTHTQSYNEDIEGYQIPEDPSVQISSDDEGTAAHSSWQDGAAKPGGKRKHAWGAGVGRCAACAAETWKAGIAGYSGVCKFVAATCLRTSLAAVMCTAVLCTHSNAWLQGETYLQTCRGRGRGVGQQGHVKTEPDSWALAPSEHLYRPCQP